ncbi:hypothetical protein OGAPHI_000742 [Ogataea philodendri]|uniref:Uncharacterized protein n=1 Tax=Ogataea philodendri TaxID=1378263 RepID=A0A9P8TAE7_9ASCO|nr:uncharacterized protein OGAPHI_000742 [Ogataea philodendri]KAH3671031.1 hypothetical protein OGAPHI_000742 [Ogataea philodendri]
MIGLFRYSTCLILTPDISLIIPIENPLTTETVQSSTLSLQSVDNVQRSDGLSLSVLGISNSVSDNVLQEGLEHCSHFFVNQSGDSLDTTSSGESSDSWLSDTLDVISKNLSVSLGTAFS